jgi:SAM-dependent methyltransferase
VHYWVGDFNEPSLPSRKYDAVFFHQSAHHVGKLEKLFRALLGVLKPGGMVYLDEFVGPSRNDWTDALLGPMRTVNRLVPPGVRMYDELPLPIQYDDPSEAIRSSEIVPQLKVGFTIEHFRGYGGNLLSVLFEVMRNPPDDFVDQLIAAERELLRSGAAPFHAVIVARPKRGLARHFAGLRYFAMPKLIRVVREARRMFAGR